jgi:glucokinase
VEAITWGEARHGAARGHRNVLGVFVGTGVGGGAVLDGRLHRGATGVAVEIGHVKVVPEGAPCGCGGRGCLEAYLGGRHLAGRLREEAEGDWAALRERAGGDPAAAHPGHLEALAGEGDERAVALLQELGGLFGLVLANAVTLLNPSALVLGGTVLEGCPTLRRFTDEVLRGHVLGVAGDDLQILAAGLGGDAGIIGAASLILEDQK